MGKINQFELDKQKKNIRYSDLKVQSFNLKTLIYYATEYLKEERFHFKTFQRSSSPSKQTFNYSQYKNH